jgi:hypothetical protein
LNLGGLLIIPPSSNSLSPRDVCCKSIERIDANSTKDG